MRLLPILLALVAALPFAPTAHAAPFEQARVSQVVNKVNVVEPQQGVRPARVNDRISGKTAVRTGVQSRSELIFPDDTVTRIGSNTLFSFTSGSRDMTMENGVMLLQSPKGAGGAKISTGAVTAAITGTTIVWEVPPKETPVAEWFIKLICIEANKDGARFYFNDRPLDSIIVKPGQMIIVPPGAKSLLDVQPVSVNIRRLLRTSLLVNGFDNSRSTTPFTLAVVDPVILEQQRKFVRNELAPTNLVIDGGGTSVLIATDYRTEADNTFALNRPAIPRAIPVNSTPSPTPTPTEPTPTPIGPTPTPIVPTPTPIVPTPTPDPKLGPPETIAGSDPYTIVNSTVIVTDPTITTFGVVDFGKNYQGEAIDGSFPVFALGNSLPFDSLTSFATAPVGTAVFKFLNLALGGAPTIDITDGSPDLVLASLGNIGSLPANDMSGVDFNFDLFGLDSLSLVANGTISIGSSVNFMAGDSAIHWLNIVARGDSGYVSLANTISGLNVGVEIAASTDVLLDSMINVAQAKVIAGNDVSLGNTLISADQLSITAGRDITFFAFDPILNSGAQLSATELSLTAGNEIILNRDNFAFVDGDTFDVFAKTITVTSPFTFSDQMNPDVVANLSAGSGGITASDNDPFEPSFYDLLGFQDISADGGDIVTGSILAENVEALNGGSIFAGNIEAESIFASGDLNANEVYARNVTVGGSTFTGYLNVENFTGEPVSAFSVGQYPDSEGRPHTFSLFSLETDSIAFNGAAGDSMTAPGNGGWLTLNIDSATFGGDFNVPTISSASFNGGDAAPSSSVVGNGGTFIVNATNDVYVGTPITATTGLAVDPSPSAPPLPAGVGGNVEINSAQGTVTVESEIIVSSDGGRSFDDPISDQGGNIKITSQQTNPAATSILINNSASLHALLGMASAGPGGVVTVQAADGRIVIDGANIEATRGTVDIQNNGVAGTIAVNNGTQIAADVVKIGALGTNGVLNIQAGSRIDAGTQIKLYGGRGDFGEVRFSGDGTVNLNAGNQIDIAAKTVTIEQSVDVNNNAPTTNVYRDNANYNQSGFGNFVGDSILIEQPVANTPPF